jgi:catechol 2,3-dioxygenase
MDTSAPDPLRHAQALRLSHMGFYVKDLACMARFYIEGLGFTQTDEGNLGSARLIFLSRDPAEHHQIVLASGRPESAHFNIINQISFRVPDLATLRHVHTRIQTQVGAHDVQCVTHGNAVSVYARDPEGNRLEVFMDTPWYCEQPLREPIDLSQDDDAVMAQALALAQGRPRFQPRAQWQADIQRKMDLL